MSVKGNCRIGDHPEECPWCRIRELEEESARRYEHSLAEVTTRDLRIRELEEDAKVSWNHYYKLTERVDEIAGSHEESTQEGLDRLRALVAAAKEWQQLEQRLAEMPASEESTREELAIAAHSAQGEVFDCLDALEEGDG